MDAKRNLFGSVIIFTFFGTSIAIPSSDGISVSSSIVIVSMGDLKSSSIMSAKGSFTSLISFEISLMSCLSSLSNSLSSIQMSYVSIFLRGLFSSKILSIKLVESSCNFCSVTALLTLSNSYFGLWNSLSMACDSVSIVWASLFGGST